MVLYDGISSVDWFYDGVKTPEEMKQDSKYSELFELPCVLLDNGNGKVYRYKPLQELAINYGILVGDDPERAYNDMLSKMAGTFVNVYDVLPFLIERANFDNEVAMSIKYAYPNWKPKETYKKDWIIKYENDLYRIGQDHTSQEQWVPGEIGTEALYSKIEITEGGYEVWQEWDGVSGIYAKDQIVKDPTNDQLYISKIDNNVWGPPSTQPDWWQLYVES